METKVSIKKIQDITRQGEEKYRALFEQASDPIMITDFGGNFLDVNTSLCKMFGYTKAQLLQMNISRLIDPIQIKEKPINFERLAEGEHVFNERRMLHRDGHIIEVEANVKKFDGDKVLAIARDVSARKKVERIIRKSEANLKTIFDNTDTSYVLLDTRLNVVAFNNKAIELSAIFLTEPLREGRSLVDCLQNHRKEQAREVLKKILAGGSEMYEACYTMPDGSERWLKVNDLPIKGNDGEILGVSIATVDITESKKAEQEKEKTQYLLNERIKELTALYNICQVLQADEKSISEVMKGIVEALPFGWQYPEITAVRIAIGDIEFKSLNFSDGKYKLRAPFYAPDDQLGFVEVVYLEEKPNEAEGPFMMEERNLINMVAEMLRVNLMRRHQAEVLKKSEANLQTIFNTTDTAFTLVNKDLMVVSFNQPTEEFVRKEIGKQAKIGTPLKEYFLADRAMYLNEMVAEIMQGRTIAYETSYKQPDGSENWYFVKFFPVPDTQNNILGLMLSIDNITERKTSEVKIKNQLQLLKDISFITSHELRHEYAKLHSIIDLLNTADASKEEEKMLLAESLTSFHKINSIIYKLNDKITFGQVTNFENIIQRKNIIENILLIDDDAIINSVHRKILEKQFNNDRIHVVNSVESALSFLNEHDTIGNYLVLLDLNMPGKTGWAFLDEYKLFNTHSPVIILSSSIDPGDKERAKGYDFVKNFVSKPLHFEVIEKIMKQDFI